ncbi:MAG: hypothetical protein OMM_12550, partial [Candidatus Magnetoglobus multicellularis str. Araruama]
MIHKNFYRNKSCGELRLPDVGFNAKLSGWVAKKRDHGGVLFIDLRDTYGTTQIVFDPQIEPVLFNMASKLKSESVISVEGEVFKRSEDTVNSKIDTGEIEIKAKKMSVESHAEIIPFPVTDDGKISEELRLTYRYLDLRRPNLHKNIKLRSKIIREMRAYMHKCGFTEFQTPILTVSSPEGARDYLVPSRVHPGKFYALPQAPQQYKQLIMCSGFDKYFQIAPSFRDEDARADRSPGEFYQLDIEMSFATQEDIFDIIEGLYMYLTPLVSDKTILHKPFPRITYQNAMND